MIYRNNSYGPIDRFCAKHPRFGIPNLMRVIVIGQIAVFLLNLLGEMLFRASWQNFLYFAPSLIFHGQVWRLVTWVFIPSSSNPFYLLLGCYFYYWIGSMLEREWGTAKFNLFYLSGMGISVALGLVLGFFQGNYYVTELGYYLNLSIFLVLATLFGEIQVLLFFLVPVKMKWMALLDVALVLVSVVQLAQLGLWLLALIPLASFVNYFIFTWPFWSAKLGLARARHDPKVVSFRKAQKQQAKSAPAYHHKCAVCGITDLDDPDMEFRYCSKCDGYYCYCAKHINNHVHIHKD